ncbi:MAG: hypothetical protein WAT39_25915 [Planctomycetota bacterium]
MLRPPSARRRPSACGASIWWFVFAVPACTVGPAWTADEQQQIAALQGAVQSLLAQPETGLTTNASVPLSPGQDVDDFDLYLNAFPELPAADGVVAVRDAGHARRLWTRTAASAGTAELTVAGRTLRGFDAVPGFTLHARAGLVLLGSRRGEQTVVTKAGTWQGSLWHDAFQPRLSTDGSHFVHVRDGWFGDDAVLAPTNDPTNGATLHYPGVVQWPLWPGADGSRVRAIVAADGRIEVHDGPRVVATADSFHHPFFDAARDELHVHLVTGGKERLLLGDRLAPPLDSYRWLEQSDDGRHWAAVGRDGDRDVLVVDGQELLRRSKLVWLALAADGNTWACASQDGERCTVHRPGGMRSGPLPKVVQLVLAGDGQQLAVCTREGHRDRWTLDDAPLGAAYDAVSDVQPLPGRDGVVFHGRDAVGWWVVTPAGRDGPWQRIAHATLVVADHYVFLAQRGEQVHRRAVPLR